MTTTQIVEFAVTSTFDYSTFELPALQQQALDTRNGFIEFCRNTFDQLIEEGSKLWDFYYQCISDLGEERGKIAFDDWLASEEFGASQYVAKAVMELVVWFRNLKPKMQGLVRRNVQKWSVSALRELAKVPTDLAQELIKRGKQTRRSIKKAAETEKQLKLRKGGYAKVLIDDYRQLSGQTGQLIDKPDEYGNIVLQMECGEEVFSVGDLQPVRKPSVPQEAFEEKYHSLIEKLEQQEQELNRYRATTTIDKWGQPYSEVTSAWRRFKNDFWPHLSKVSLGAVAESSVTQPDPINEITQEQLDAFLARASAEHEQIKGEEHAAHYTEIEANAIALAETNKNLEEQLRQKERELDEIKSLQLQAYEAENQQLRQRVQDLEKAFSESAINRLDYIEAQDAFTTPELEKKYESLLEKVEQEERELDGYRASSNIGLETAINEEDAEALATKLSTALELFGIPGWGRQGYCATNNRIYKGWDAVKAFLQEAFSINQTSEKWGVA